MQDDHDHLAETMLANELLRRDPCRIQSWLLLHYEYTAYPAIFYNAKQFYFDIVVDQMRQPESPVRNSLMEYVTEYFHTGVGIRFVTINGHRDYTWSCGLRPSEVGENNSNLVDPPGLDLYGQVLTEVLEKIVSCGVQEKWGIAQLCTRQVFSAQQRVHTIMVLADSMTTEMISVDGGTVHVRSGATFRSLVQAVHDNNYDLHDYNRLIICDGVNDAQMPFEKRNESWLVMENFLLNLIDAGYPAYNILVSLPTPRADIPQISEYSFWIQSRLQQHGINVLNWCEMQENPFQHPDGSINLRVFNKFLRDPYNARVKDQFHINHAGVREILRRWFEIFPELVNLRFNLKWRPRARAMRSNNAR
jgi:hypothetical protein